MNLVVTTSRAITAIMLAVTLSVTVGCSDTNGQQAVPGSSKAAKLTQCVRPTEFMRRNHFELIQHQRDITVHQGIRATSDSLAACIACHVQYDANGKAVPVNTKGQFCNGCHEWLAVQPDCFGCHSTVPEGKQPSNLYQQWPSVFEAPPPPPKPKPKEVKPASTASTQVPVKVDAPKLEVTTPISVPVQPVATPAPIPVTVPTPTPPASVSTPASTGGTP
jgi:predicted CXXCH cytochrome family protein